MSGYIARSIQRNDLLPALFVEPFAGGASVALSQLSAGLIGKVILNDRDPLIASFWATLFFDTDWLLRRVQKCEVTLDEWMRVKRSDPQSTRGRAYKCLFLNRTSFSGVLTERAGPIGGKAQRSPYRLDCRFSKPTVIRRIQEAAQFRSRVAGVWNLPWDRAMLRVLKLQCSGRLPEAALFYLDPPFYNKASELYRYYFERPEHERLRDFLSKFSHPWILSYDASPHVLDLYRTGGFRASNVNLIYTASQKSKRGIGNEIIVSNLPRMVSELQLGTGKRAGRPQAVSSIAIEHRIKSERVA
jgi:DNA adenine methylase